MPVKRRDIYVLLKQTGFPGGPGGSNVQRGMWPCVTTCYKRIVEEGTGGGWG